MAEQPKDIQDPWIAYGTWVSTSNGPLIADCDTDAHAEQISALPEFLALAERIKALGFGGINEDIRAQCLAALAKARGEAIDPAPYVHEHRYSCFDIYGKLNGSCA